MKFIVLLFAVLLQRQTKKQGYQRNRVWFTRLVSPFNVMDAGLAKQVWVFCLLVLLPSALLMLLMANLTGFIGGLIGIVIQVAVLLYVLGRDDFSLRFESYKECWKKEDYQGAYHCAQQFLNLQNQTDSQTPFQLHQSVRRAMVYVWFVRFFVFVFWFLALGIAGAFACLMSYWFYREYRLPWVKSLLEALEWLPARLMAFSFALAGDFTRSFSLALKFALDFSSDSKTVLMKTLESVEALDEEAFNCETAKDSLEEVNKLMYRCAVLWLLAVGVLTIFGGF